MANKLVLLLALCVCLPACLAIATPDPKDGTPAPYYTVNLDLPPEQRWNELVDAFRPQLKKAVDFFEGRIPTLVRPAVLAALADLGDHMDETFEAPYAAEVRGVAARLGVPTGLVLLTQFLYELSAACTSIVAETPNGQIFHARNLDYGNGPDDDYTATLKALTVDLDFQQHNTTVYKGTSFVGYLGLVTGMRPHAFSISLDETSGPSWGVLLNGIEFVRNKQARLPCFLIRDVLLNATSYAGAVDALASAPMLAPAYLIVGGVRSGEGVVLSRLQRESTKDVWQLDPPHRWYLVETNYNHWEAPPSDDDRRTPAIAAMEKMGQESTALDSLYQVLSTPMVCNDETAYTTVMQASSDTHHSFVRVCQ